MPAIADIACIDDADPMMSETTDPIDQLEQDTYHFLTQDPNGNPDAPGRGVNIPAMLSGVVDSTIGDVARAEVLRDDRVAACATSLETDGDPQRGENVTLNLEITPNDTTAGQGATASVQIEAGT